MSDKSPHQKHSAKKSTKDLKDKRREREEQRRTSTQVEQLLHPHKSHS